jgi:acetolactate synthase-1/3 small subunit
MTDPLKDRAIAILVRNRPDVLARIAGTFSARGFNIESISANVTRNPAVTKIIITTLSTRETIARIIKQINRLVDVLDVRRLTRTQAVRREMILARVPLTDERKGAILKLLDRYGGRMAALEPGSAVLEFSGDEDTILEILDRLEALGMEDLARSGVVAVERVKP